MGCLLVVVTRATQFEFYELVECKFTLEDKTEKWFSGRIIRPSSQGPSKTYVVEFTNEHKCKDLFKLIGKKALKLKSFEYEVPVEEIRKPKEVKPKLHLKMYLDLKVFFAVVFKT